MNERSELMSWIRGEVVGPTQVLTSAEVVAFHDKVFSDPATSRYTPISWRPHDDADVEEILFYDRETPHRKFGAGLLHPAGIQTLKAPDEVAAEASDTIGVDATDDDTTNAAEEQPPAKESGVDLAEPSDEFEVTSPDVRHPTTLGLTCCVALGPTGQISVALPLQRKFPWQEVGSPPFSLNGRYEHCTRAWTDEQGQPKTSPMWRRRPAVLADVAIVLPRSELTSGRAIRREVPMPAGSPLKLRVELFPRQLQNQPDLWLITVVLRNTSSPTTGEAAREAVLYQTYFEVVVQGGSLEKYPESQRPFDHLDAEEQSLALLYRESATWAIGHGCAAGWDAGPGESPIKVYADVMPAVEIPSMTPDITDAQGNPIQLSMRKMASLPDDGTSGSWQALSDLATQYAIWIQARRNEVASLPAPMRAVASRHLDGCDSCLARIKGGIALIRSDRRARTAFKLANLAMILQQIATKQLQKRQLEWDESRNIISPLGTRVSPWTVYRLGQEHQGIGTWRAFQIAFLLMSIEGMTESISPDREIVDLIWFPTGGGKTEAYLGVMAFYMIHQRLMIGVDEGGLRRDGTNVFMRYTLRMLTTQQFQRGASLICAMEFLRRQPEDHSLGDIPGQRFSLGLWIGGEGSPNKIAEARRQLNSFRAEKSAGNPLVLTECPWCRAEIGRYDGPRPRTFPQAQWKAMRIRGISNHPSEGPLLRCSDGSCEFGSEQWQQWLPVEVIDERIYANAPSLVIGTADKFAIVAYRPAAGALFGRDLTTPVVTRQFLPPGLIIQDELHLIAGPLGTIYGLYEGIFERLCSLQVGEHRIKPKLIASTATIRGAADQIRALYARTDPVTGDTKMQLFPMPGLLMGDSFFGKYARTADGTLRPGRVYFGIHANDYGSVLTTQVRVFSSVLYRPAFLPMDRRDPWWSLLVFYNSIRELGGAKTLFDSDIRSRLKFLFNRANIPVSDRRNLRIVEELTSRLSQAEIVGMMDQLSIPYSQPENSAVDACLASSIIEVGVDIDRLSLMGVVGQPKTTAQYIQVTGRVGRRWWDRAGLIMMIYNPSKSRDRSHFEQFHSYHRRLYERVEPTSATPFALSAIQRALPGALLTWARQHSGARVQDYASYEDALTAGFEILSERCTTVQNPEDRDRSLREMDRVRSELIHKWGQNPQKWEEFPPSVNGEYLMLWPGQFATVVQKQNGVVVPSSMRQVDASGELTISQGYAAQDH